ncbi:VOC family protein [Paractinoplanes deccanensis]|uniref:VOC family protein n=1 Tax=Paractinoplanes deccanensis TaxID=113561 RepID=A0ABQ3Y732_9ACTN|nr:VOC family protein [Actinoplanes deccanensis]GID75803.1 VOC family protein [Actinoplanes deccanensis]
MSITTTTHLNFRGDARAALEFYQSVFGGDVAVVPHPDGAGVMWGQVLSAGGFHVMAYDVPAGTSYDQGDKSFFLSVRGTAPDEITGYWKGLSEGATVLQELAPSGWSPLYGMLTDRFGVTWVLDVTAG